MRMTEVVRLFLDLEANQEKDEENKGLLCQVEAWCECCA